MIYLLAVGKRFRTLEHLGPVMVDCARIVEYLELALIELEYAMADFAHDKALRGDPVAPPDLEAIRRKMLAANQAMDLAAQVLGAGDGFGEATRSRMV